MPSASHRLALHPLFLAAACVVLGGAAEARDRPGTPANMTAKALSPTAVGFNFMNTASRDELVSFEIEQTVNGERIPHAAEAAMSSGFVSGTGSAWLQFRGDTVRDLTPQTEYCFRAWSRVVSSGVRSAGPSNWGCARTPPHPPLAPFDVKAELRNVATDRPRLSWNTPDQSGWRGIDRYVIERQSPPGENRPWILEKAITGPRGEQAATTRLMYATGTTAVDPRQKHSFRVCAENEGGRTCAKPVLLAIADPSSADQQAAVSRVVPTQPAAGTASSLSDARKARPGAAVSSTQPLQPRSEQSVVRAGATIDRQALNPQPLPPKDPSDPTAPIERQGLNPQPLPPRDAATSISAAPGTKAATPGGSTASTSNATSAVTRVQSPAVVGTTRSDAPATSTAVTRLPSTTQRTTSVPDSAFSR